MDLDQTLHQPSRDPVYQYKLEKGGIKAPNVNVILHHSLSAWAHVATLHVLMLAYTTHTNTHMHACSHTNNTQDLLLPN